MIVVLSGAPGAGKGTQADFLSQRLGFKKVSTGDALRRQVKEGTEVGNEAGAIMARGGLVPDDVLVRILGYEMAGLGQTDRILLDGYPRNLGQASSLQEGLGVHKVVSVVHLDVPQSVLVARLSGRRVCAQCGTSFHVLDNPPRSSGLCDRCGHSLVHRPDDRPESVKTRLDVFDEMTRPIFEFYEARGLYHRVDGVGSPETIHNRISDFLKNAGLLNPEN